MKALDRQPVLAAPLAKHGEPAPASVDAVQPVTRFNLATLNAVPWKNGGGTTREIACWPPQADMESFLWRISVARIDRDGAFSPFPGVDRVITLLEGQGVLLVPQDAAHNDGGNAASSPSHALTQALAPYAFDGAWPIFSKLVGGPCEDLNVMSRHGLIEADVVVLHDTGRLTAATAGMLLAVNGRWHVQDAQGAHHTLAPGEGVWWSQQSNAWTVTPDSASPQTDLFTVALRDIGASDRAGVAK